MLRTRSHKLKCITQDDIPTKSQIQQNLGISLAQIFFDYNHHEAIKLLDSISSMKDLQQPCGVKQDDPLKISTIQTSLEKQEILKLSIHRDILALGENVLKKLQAEIEAITHVKLKNEYIEKCDMLEAEKRLALARNAEEIHAKYEDYIKFVQQDLEEKLKVEWADSNAKHGKELQKAVVRARQDTVHDVLKNIRSEMHYILTCLHGDFEQSHRVQRENIIADFNEIMRRQHIKLDARIKQVEREKIEALYVQNREFEIQNAADIIYVLCMERLRNSSQIQALHKHFEGKIKVLQEVIVKQDSTINMMKEKLTEYSNKNVVLQEKITAITNEFQKFINSAFDAVPEQSDFLLSSNLFSINDVNKNVE